MGHARVLSKLESEERIIELAHQIIEEKLPVREIESIASDKSVEKKLKFTDKKKIIMIINM